MILLIFFNISKIYHLKNPNPYIPMIFSISKRILPIYLLFFFNSLSAQSPKPPKGVGTWVVYSGDYTLNKRWQVNTKAQYRDYKFFADTRLLISSLGMTYTFKSIPLSLSAGYMYLDNRRYLKRGKVRAHENRIFQHAVLKGKLGSLALSHRYRIEQRFFSHQDGFQFRFRYKLSGKFPLYQSKTSASSLYSAFYEEIRIQNSNPFFQSNRLYAGIGYKMNSNISLEGGWMTQLNPRSATHQTIVTIKHSL